MNYTESYEILDVFSLSFLLESLKSVSSDIILIPKNLKQIDTDTSILGIKAHTIYSLSVFEKFAMINDLVFWQDPSIEYIALHFSSISPFLRAIKQNNLSYIQMNYKTYIVNGKRKSVATAITTDKAIKVNTAGIESDWVPTIELIPPYQFVEEAKYHINLFDKSHRVDTINPQDNEFTYIWSQPASSGAKVWIPRLEYYKNNTKPYIMYLSKTMFSVAKSDTLELDIRNNIPNQPGHFFMTRFKIGKRKKAVSSYHYYYMTSILV